MMKLVRISGDTYYVPGTTNVCVYGDYVVDPGKNDHVDWDRPEISFGRNIANALVSHGHNDHFWNAASLRRKGVKIFSPRGERPMIEDIDVHMKAFFLGVKPPEGMRPWYFRGTPCPVDGTIEELEMPLKPVPMPGHTEWQMGFMTPDGVLLAVDAIVDKKMWETKGIVYHTSIPHVRRSLRAIMDSSADWVLPAHTPLLTKDEAVQLAEINLNGIDRLEHIVLDSLDMEGISTEEAVSRVCLALKLKEDFTMHLVGETTVRAFLHDLFERKAVDYELKGHKVLWRKTR
jgi:glyoxylase-like metal-dependent hydrolase (beta-lactamase superfamily II)